MQDGARREPSGNAAESQTLSMCGNSMRENRETPAVSAPLGGAERPEKTSGRTSGMHAAGESDDLVVPAKRANKAGPSAAAESVEERRSTKGNFTSDRRVPDAVPGVQVDCPGGGRQEGLRLLVDHPR